MVSSTIIILRLIHIVGGVFWVGAMVTLARFVLPSVEAIGPAGGAFMRELGQVRKLPVAMGFAGVFTVLSGIGLYWMFSSMSNGAFAHSHMGITLGIGGALALVAAIIGATVVRPAGNELMALGAQVAAQGGPPTPAQQAEMGALRGKMQSVTKMVMAMLGLTTILMAIARYI